MMPVVNGLLRVFAWMARAVTEAGMFFNSGESSHKYDASPATCGELKLVPSCLVHNKPGMPPRHRIVTPSPTALTLGSWFEKPDSLGSNSVFWMLPTVRTFLAGARFSRPKSRTSACRRAICTGDATSDGKPARPDGGSQRV